MIYKLCKKIIESGNYESNSLITKLDVFLLGNRITLEEYEELVSLIIIEE